MLERNKIMREGASPVRYAQRAREATAASWIRRLGIYNLPRTVEAKPRLCIRNTLQYSMIEGMSSGEATTTNEY